MNIIYGIFAMIGGIIILLTIIAIKVSNPEIITNTTTVYIINNTIMNITSNATEQRKPIPFFNTDDVSAKVVS